MHQRNGAAADSGLMVTTQSLAQPGSELQWSDLMALRIQTAIHLFHSRNQGWRLGDRQGKQILSMLITDAQQIRQPPVGEK